jgi:hypothetical protein
LSGDERRGNARATFAHVFVQPIPLAFRMCSFVATNVPIIAGMLLAPPTIPNTVFWQWLNQSYNAGYNYSNRSGRYVSPVGRDRVALTTCGLQRLGQGDKLDRHDWCAVCCRFGVVSDGGCRLQ